MTTTTFAATVTPMNPTIQLGATTKVDPQVIWKIIDGLKPSDKAKITKGDNKLRHEMAERNKSYQDEQRKALDLYCPPRDEKIAEAKAKRDAIVAQANAEFEAVRKEAQDEFLVQINPTYKEQETAWSANYDIYREQWIQLVREVSGQEIG